MDQMIDEKKIKKEIVVVSLLFIVIVLMALFGGYSIGLMKASDNQVNKCMQVIQSMQKDCLCLYNDPVNAYYHYSGD